MKACTLFSSDNEVAEDWLVKFNSREPLDIYGQKYLIDEISTDYELGFSGVTIRMYPVYQAKSPERPKKQEAWDGSGKPPIGIECEVRCNDVWSICKTLAYHQVSDTAVAVHFLDGSNSLFWCATFRPIKTAEKLKEEEKVAAIAEMQSVVMAASGCTVSTISECLAIVALYEAGYRKQ